MSHVRCGTVLLPMAVTPPYDELIPHDVDKSRVYGLIYTSVYRDPARSLIFADIS
jgi:hypothetical protein